MLTTKVAATNQFILTFNRGSRLFTIWEVLRGGDYAYLVAEFTDGRAAAAKLAALSPKE
jgi:hypothetical protein